MARNSKQKPAKRSPARPTAPPPAALPPASAVSREDQALAAEAMRKEQRGAKPTHAELRAKRRVLAERERVQRETFYRSIPQKVWREASGCSYRVVADHVARWRVPVGNPTISLYEVAAWVHSFLADQATVLAAGASADPLLAGDSPALERYRLASAKIKELELATKKNQLIERAAVHDMLTRFAGSLRRVLEQLERKFGPEARDLAEAALDACAAEVRAIAVEHEDDGAAG